MIKHSGYIVNGIHFTTKDRDDARTTQNSGVSLVAQTMQVSSAKDKNLICSDMVFYGVIKEIWELDYVGVRIPMFLCDWVESNNGVRIDDNGFTLVNLNRAGHKDEPFIMASQAKQVFYVCKQKDASWSYVFATQPKDYAKEVHEEDDSEILIEKLTPNKGLSSDNMNHSSYSENDPYSREGVDGIWIDSTIPIS